MNDYWTSNTCTRYGIYNINSILDITSFAWYDTGVYTVGSSIVLMQVVLSTQML